MNKIKVSALAILVSIAATAQAQWSGTNPLTTTSSVGISTTSPQGYLHVSPSFLGLPYAPGIMALIKADYTDNWGALTETFVALNNGRVGIGTANPNATCHVVGTTTLEGNTDIVGNVNLTGSFTVNNGGANQFKVSQNGLVNARQFDVHLDPIPDYVFHNAFDKDSAIKYKNEGTYKMLTLNEVDTFVQQNRHLPGIKSAAEYQQDGSINIGELQLQLLKKVEELTLYNIQLMKEMEELKKKQAELEQANKLLKR